MFKSDGDIDFTKSFFKFVNEDPALQKIVTIEGQEYGQSFPTLINTQARQEEHHRLLDKYGFPGELEPEYARYTPVIEEDPSLMAHKVPPWNVNEAGQNLGLRHYDDALTPPQLGRHMKRGVVEGANSIETPVSKLNATDSFTNILSQVANKQAKEAGHPWYTPESAINKSDNELKKSDDFFNWMAQEASHMYKADCPCEFCFQKTADYKGTIEKRFLDLGV